MSSPRPQVLATSGGLRQDDRHDWRPAALLDHALALSGAVRPRLCLLMTAMGDDPALLARMYSTFDGRDDVAVSHLALFPMPNVEDQRLVADGTLPTAYCTDDGVGLHYVGTELVEAVSEIEGKGAYVVERAPGERAVERRIEARLLTEP